MSEITEQDRQRAEQIIRDTHTSLPDIWLGGRQRYVLVERMAQEFSALTAELAAVKADRDHWKAEAVWAADTMLYEDLESKRAQAILKEAGDA